MWTGGILRLVEEEKKALSYQTVKWHYTGVLFPLLYWKCQSNYRRYSDFEEWKNECNYTKTIQLLCDGYQRDEIFYTNKTRALKSILN
jgi:hypothetical protein